MLITVDDVTAQTGTTYVDTELAKVNAFIEGVSSLIEDFCYPATIPTPTPGSVKMVAVSEVRRYLNVEPGIAQERVDNLSEAYEAGGATVALSPGSELALKRWRRTRRRSISTLRVVRPENWDEIPPITPTDLMVSGTASTSISLEWTAVWCVAGYRVYEGTTLVADVCWPNVTILGLAPSTSHTYTVLAYDGQGNTSPLSTPVTGVTSP